MRPEGALPWSCDANKVMFGRQEAQQDRLLLKQSKKRVRWTSRGSEWSWWRRPEQMETLMLMR